MPAKNWLRNFQPNIFDFMNMTTSPPLKVTFRENEQVPIKLKIYIHFYSFANLFICLRKVY